MRNNIIFLVMLLVFLSNSAFGAGSKLVNSEKLTKDELQPMVSRNLFTIQRPGFDYIPSKISPSKIRIVGIHQIGNKADVYVGFFDSKNVRYVGVVKLVRFNHGDWYCPRDSKYIVKGQYLP